MLQLPLFPEESFSYKITIDDLEWNIRIAWNNREGSWYLNLSNELNSTYVNGIGLLGGVDILKQYPIDLKYLYLFNISDSYEDPTVDNLSTQFALIKFDESEIAEFEEGTGE